MNLWFEGGAPRLGPLRDPVSASGTRTTGYCALGPDLGYQPMESLLERRALVMFAACAFLRGPFAQGAQLDLTGPGGKPSRYTADQVLPVPWGTYLGETKFAKDFKRPEVAERLDRVHQKAKEAGYLGLLRLDEHVIDRQPRLENAFVIKRYRLFPVERSLELRLLARVLAMPGISVATLRDECPAGKGNAVYALLSRRLLVTDPNVPVANAPLWHASVLSTKHHLEESYEDVFNRS